MSDTMRQTEQFVASLQKNQPHKSFKMLEAIMKQKCATKIAKTLEEKNKDVR